MAVASTSASKGKVSDQVEKKNKINSSKNEPKSPKKRTKCPGVRMIHGRIYDSENGKTCHQCRQKTLDFSADCKNQAKDKPCPLKFCHTCLLNRYGEKAEEMASLEDWQCPRCRGICNCSLCMKKRGHRPTGTLVHTAKASGFSSVSDLLHVKGPENVGHYKSEKELGASPRKRLTTDEATVVTSPKKRGKENLFDGKRDLNMHPLPSAPHPIEEKPKKMKRKGLKDMHDSNGDVDTLLSGSSPSLNEKKQKKLKFEGLKETHDGNGSSDHLLEETSPQPDNKKEKKTKPGKSKEMLDGDGNTGARLEEASPKKPQSSKRIHTEDKTNKKGNAVQQEEKSLMTSVHKEVSSDFFEHGKRDEVKEKKNRIHKDVAGLDSKRYQNQAQDMEIMEYCQVYKNPLDFPEKCLDAANPLPTGSELTTLAGTDLPMEVVGNALQFLEFCAAFGKILDLRKGQGEVVLRELINGRRARRGKPCLIVQFHIQLLSVIQEELESESPTLNLTHGNNSWLGALKKCIPKSQLVLDSLHLDHIDREVGGYDCLDSSTKLRLLNFLCDEVLGTEKIRNWIDDQNSKFAEKSKEVKARVIAAKDKEKHLKQKMQDDIAKAIIARKGAPLSITEHEAIVSQIKHEVAQAHAELLESKRLVPEGKKRPDAVRTEPILLDTNGSMYWRLKAYSDKSDILLQDIGTGDDAVGSGEKWLRYGGEQINMIEKHINALRKGRKITQI